MTKRTLGNYGHIRIRERVFRPASFVFGASAVLMAFQNIWGGLVMAGFAIGFWIEASVSRRKADRWLAENPEFGEWHGHQK